MSFLPKFRRTLRIARPRLSKEASRDVAEEVEFHLESRIRELTELDGLSRAAAEARARREFGDVTETARALRRQTVRAERRVRLAESSLAIGSDMRRAVRTLVRAPGYAVTAIVTLATGIGATLAIYAVLDSVALERLPYPAAERLVDLYSSVPGLGFERWELSEAGFVHFRGSSRSFESVGAYRTGAATIELESGASRIAVAAATPELLAMLGGGGLSGRLYSPPDGQQGAAVAMLSHRTWASSFAGDPSVVGERVRIQGQDREVVGVLPRGLELPDQRVDVWIPLAVDELDPNADSHSVRVVARRAPDAGLPAVQAELDRLTAQLSTLHPDNYAPAWMRESGFRTVAQTLEDRVVGDSTRRALWILMGAAALMFLIAAANVVNLALVRALDRADEIGLRTALGAGGGHLRRVFATEAAALVTTAGLLGLGTAALTVRAARTLAPAGFPRLEGVELDGSVLVLAAGAVGILSLLLTAIPLVARRGGRLRPAPTGGARATGGPRLRAVRGTLVAAQVALALILLNSAGLLVRSFRALSRVDPGFTAASVVAVDVSLAARDYPDQESVHAFYRDVLAEVGALPGVSGAGAVSSLPLEPGLGCYSLWVEAHPLAEGESPPCIDVHVATAGYFATLGMAPSEGRWLEPGDDDNRTGALVVTRTLADRLWPGRSPIGEGASMHGHREPWFRVVGVTGDLRSERLDRPPTAGVFFPLVSPEGARRFLGHRAGMTVVARVESGGAEAAIAGIRRAVTTADPGVAAANPRLLQDVVASGRAETTLATTLLSSAAGVSLLLGVVGLLGVVSYSVARRTREIGVRMALGADARGIRRLVLAQSGRLVAAGVALGVVGALLTGRLLEGLLFGTPPEDPVTLVFVAALLTLAAMLGALVPAARAARVDPVRALRRD